MSKKIIAFLVLAVTLVSILVGCTADEMAAFNAYTKMTTVNSMESTSEVTIDLSATGLPANEQAAVQQVVTMLNGSKFNISQKISQNDQKTISKQQTDLKMNLAGLQMDMGVWTDSDLTGSKPKMREIIGIPAIATYYLPEQFQSKEYMVMDLDSLTGSSGINNADLSKLINFNKDFQSKLSSFLKDYALKFDPGFQVITKKGNDTVDGKDVTVYELKLDDTAFKALVKYTVTDLANNENALNLIKECVLTLVGATASMDSSSKAAVAEIEKSFADVKNEIPQFITEFNKVMDAIKNVKIIGDKGIVVDFAIDNSGYIIKENGYFDIVIDTKAIQQATNVISGSKSKLTDAGVYKLGVGFNTDIKNINEKVDITFPQVDKSNSFSYSDLLKYTTAAQAKITAKPAKDATPPATPVVNKVTRKSKVITGKTEAGAVVTITKGNKIIGKGIADKKGNFSIKIRTQKAGTVLAVIAKDKVGNTSKATKVIVKK